MNTEVKEFLRLNGKKGGLKTAKRGKEFYSKIGKKGMKKRWGNRRQLPK
jgi:general stress protein YciG